MPTPPAAHPNQIRYATALRAARGRDQLLLLDHHPDSTGESCGAPVCRLDGVLVPWPCWDVRDLL